MIPYVVGFAFDEGPYQYRIGGEVALIRKARPDWQRGCLNGIGGHIEEGESSHEAMVREFKEETDVEIVDWNLFAKLQGKDWSVDFYRAFGIDLTTLKTVTDEEVLVYPVDRLPAKVLPNLRWLIPLALDSEPLTPALVMYG